MNEKKLETRKTKASLPQKKTNRDTSNKHVVKVARVLKVLSRILLKNVGIF